MQKDLTIYNELKELSPFLSGLPKTNVFSVPDGYFDTFAPDTLLKINKLTLTEQKTTQTVPEGYFDNLPLAILSRIREEAILEESGNLLGSIPKVNVFKVPDDYFEHLPGMISGKLPKQAKVVGFGSRPAMFRYAAAAVITGLLGLALFNGFNRKDEIPAGYSPVVLAEAKKIIQENTIDEVFNSFNDAEITHYLQSTGEDVNTALVASLADDSNLPDADEYYFNEQALDNLLDKLQVPTSFNN